jgi:hypothetical protein
MDFKKFSEQVGLHGWLVRMTDNVIEIYKQHGPLLKKKTVSVIIRKVRPDEYVMEFPTNPFISVTAAFAPKVENEIRLCRAASIISSMYSALRNTEIVSQIVNWTDVVVLNQYNKNVNKRWALDKLKRMQFRK